VPVLKWVRCATIKLCPQHPALTGSRGLTVLNQQ
jgi:hypothetical protein